MPDGDYNFVLMDFGSNGTSYTLKDGSTVLASGNNIIFGNVHQLCIRQSQNLQLDQIRPSTISDLSASNISNTSIDLTWSLATDNNAMFSQLVFVDGQIRSNLWQNGVTSTSVINLSPNTTYDFTIVSWDVGGNFSAKSNTLTVTTTGSSTNATNTSAMALSDNANEVLVSSKLKLYPNPATSYFKIENLEATNTISEVIVYDTSGKLVKQYKESSLKYNVNDVKDGLYIIEIKFQNAKSKFDKLIIKN